LLGHVFPFDHCRLLIRVRWKRPGCSANKLDGNAVQNSDITGSFMTAYLME